MHRVTISAIVKLFPLRNACIVLIALDGGSFLNWTSAHIHSRTNESLDVVFQAQEGNFHWVIYQDLAGAYQYFVNKALPVLGEFRSLVRLDNATFFNGKTNTKKGTASTFTSQVDLLTFPRALADTGRNY
jgi:hypothetical protein